MTTATLRLSTPISAAQHSAQGPARARFIDALVEARMRAAMREIAQRRHLIPEDLLKKAGYSATVVGRQPRYPFTR